MVVLITNITDGPGQKPREVRIYGKRLLPGKSLRVAAQYVDSKVRDLEAAGAIALGQVPPWYQDYKEKRAHKNLTPEQVAQNLAASKELAEKKRAAKETLAGQPQPSGGGKKKKKSAPPQEEKDAPKDSDQGKE